MQDLIGKKFPVLGHGHVVLLAYTGSDAEIADAARTSYQGGTRSTSDDRGLIRYLMRHRHTTPFEFAWLKFHVKLPIFVERQWIRHRTFSTNEVSARYSVLPDEAYVPEAERIAEQSKANKQGSGNVFDRSDSEWVIEELEFTYSDSFKSYKVLLDTNVTRELARLPLPVATYTEKVWAGSLHNLLHFLELRLDEHAQWEIRQYAQVISKIVEELFPATWDAFCDYRLCAMTMSAQEVICLREILDGRPVQLGCLSAREKEEFTEKMRRVGKEIRSER